MTTQQNGFIGREVSTGDFPFPVFLSCTSFPFSTCRSHCVDVTTLFPWEVAQSCAGFSCICSVLFSSLLQDIEDTLEQAKHMNIYCHFAKGLGEPGYRPVPTWEELNQILVEALDNYNEVNAAMNLVLFEDAMCHV